MFFSYLNPTSYLNGKSQKIKLSSSFSSELDVSYAIPQGSILGPLLFNIDVCDLLSVDITSDIASYLEFHSNYHNTKSGFYSKLL